MRRRAADYRRPVRRRLWCWIWSVLVLFCLGGLVLFVIQHNHNADRTVRFSSEERTATFEEVNHRVFNLTDEIASATSFSRQLAEQMTLAKAYIIIAKDHNNLHLAWELSSKFRKSQLLLSAAALRGEPLTLEEAGPVIKSMSALIYKAQDLHYDISTTITTMQSHIQALEERANAAVAQNVVFGQLTVESIPRDIHCSIIKLASDWIQNPTLRNVADELRNSPRLVDNNLYHFCVFSDNLLGTSVVVNSTVSNADHPKQLVFHVVTDGVNFGPMQAWFLSNDFKGATIEVQNTEDLSWLNATYLEASRDMKGSSFLNRLRFYIPDVYPQLEKVVLLDDDVVVQKDLTSLFSIELHGNVNGVVETCLEAFHRYHKYLNFSNPIISSKLDPQACGWAFGMNVFDLIAWRKANVTARYHYWLKQNEDRTLWKLGILPPGLLAFYGLTEPLDRRWHVQGLGFDPNIDSRLIESAAVIHFNGNMKPWIKLCIERYKPLWERYINMTHPHFQECASS
ncbi:hypothetical protein SAY86_015644 [Trapa natans]|uniref:Hexosyltransferase n=1 Tax=Trapa natans TaxID=22666 RepID=A0AAN7L847_TRANT|nr:hypothetical protein SAY86_015644 [Trapa natans]